MFREKPMQPEQTKLEAGRRAIDSVFSRDITPDDADQFMKKIQEAK
ncbi:MAG: hypothetical protein V1867_04280 [Candidatus Falkowbacteria bacterium]